MGQKGDRKVRLAFCTGLALGQSDAGGLCPEEGSMETVLWGSLGHSVQVCPGPLHGGTSPRTRAVVSAVVSLPPMPSSGDISSLLAPWAAPQAPPLPVMIFSFMWSHGNG